MHDTRQEVDLNPEHYQYQSIHHQNIYHSDNLLTILSRFKVSELCISKFKVELHFYA